MNDESKYNNEQPVLFDDKKMCYRIIKLIKKHKLEVCLKYEEKKIILSEVLAQLIYGDLSPSIIQIDDILHIIYEYKKEIYNGCCIHELSTSANYEFPTSS